MDIYVPENHTEKKLPVIQWTYGQVDGNLPPLDQQ
jgi:hypothetical protein